MRKHDGNVHAEAARQVHSDGGEEIILVSVWRDLDAIYGWLGVTDLLETPTRDRAEPSVFKGFEVQHYEVLETDDVAAINAEEMAATADADGPEPGAVALDF